MLFWLLNSYMNYIKTHPKELVSDAVYSQMISSNYFLEGYSKGVEGITWNFIS